MGDEIDFTNEEQRNTYITAQVKEQLDAQLDEKTQGLKTKNEELLGKLTKATDGNSALQTLIESLGGEENITKLTDVQKQLSNDERLKKLTSNDPKQIQEVIDAETAVARGQLEKRLDDAATALTEANTKAESATHQLQLNNLRSVVGKASAKLECRQGQEDEIFREAQSVFSFDENNMPVVMENDLVKLGADGKANFSAAEWLETTRETNSYRWPDSKAGGALGSGDDGGGGGLQKTYDNQKDFERDRKAQKKAG